MADSIVRKHKTYQLWDEARRREAVDLYLSGIGMQEVGKILHSNNTRVKAALVYAGVQLRVKKWKRRVWTAERDAEIARLYQGGMSVMALGVRFKTNAHRVSDSLTRSGIEIRPCPTFPKGEDNPSWNGGRMVDGDGYTLLYRPEHPDARLSGYVLEHRLVMEEMIGRRLRKGEVVHHKNPPKSNNDPSNLELFSSNSKHLQAELTGRVPKWTDDGLRRIRAAHPSWKINLALEET